MKERLESLKAFNIGDEYIENAPIIETEDFYKENRIDKTIHAHTLEDHDYYVSNYYSYADKNNMLVRLEYTKSISTTDIINRIFNIKNN